MKVILTENIDRLGKAGDVVSVKEGYARNFLIPGKKAKLATDANIKFADAVAGSGMLITDACPIAALEMIVLVFPVFATPATTREPLLAAEGNEATVPAVRIA